MKKTIVRDLIHICCVFFLFLLLIFSLIMEAKVLWIYLLIIAPPFVLLSIYTILYVKKKIIKPIKYLSSEARFISAGDLSRKIEHRSNDEMGDFISVFDSMRSTLYKQQKQQEQFEMTRKNFIDSISHDLKTPLASISAYIEALQDGIVSTPEEEQQYLKVIENKVAVLTKLSNHLSMSYETPDTLSLSSQKVNCYSWSVDFLSDMEVECAMKGVVSEFVNAVPDSDKHNIWIDIYQFDRALQNLASNAFRYYEKYFSISVEIRNDQFVIVIKNDGAKLDNHNLNNIFERFYTEEEVNEKGHLGLGLYISKTIINAMHGEIKVKKEAEMIQFQIVLPIL